MNKEQPLLRILWLSGIILTLILPPRRHLVTSGDISGVTVVDWRLGCSMSYNARTAPHNNYLAQNINSAKAGNP